MTSVRSFKDILRKELDLAALPDALVRVHGEVDQPRFARAATAFAVAGEA